MIPAALADDWIDFVFAARQPLSEPTCENPSVIVRPQRASSVLLAAPPARTDSAKSAVAAITRANTFFNT